jgi:DNA-binding NarL/FixJ family response regulator
MNILKLAQAARGAASPDEMFELLSQIGIEIETKDIEMREEPAAEALRQVAIKAIHSHSRFVEMTMRFKQGGVVVAFLILPSTT